MLDVREVSLAVDSVFRDYGFIIAASPNQISSESSIRSERFRDAMRRGEPLFISAKESSSDNSNAMDTLLSATYCSNEVDDNGRDLIIHMKTELSHSFRFRIPEKCFLFDMEDNSVTEEQRVAEYLVIEVNETLSRYTKEEIEGATLDRLIYGNY